MSLFVRSLLFVLFVSVIYSCKDEPVEPTLMPKASFNTSATQVGTDIEIKFTNSSENANHYIWDFADGNMSANENPSHAFEEIGVYRVSLVAIGYNLSDTTYKNITVTEGNISIFEGQGITGVSLYETTWSDLELNFGLDTISAVNYSEEFDYYYFIVSYPDLGIDFLIYSNGEAELNEDAYVYVIFVSGPQYKGGTTTKGIGIFSTGSAMEEAYGDPEEEVSGESPGGTYTYYRYPSIGVDFFHPGTNIIQEIAIYAPVNSTSRSTKSLKGVKESIQALSKDYLFIK